VIVIITIIMSTVYICGYECQIIIVRFQTIAIKSIKQK
jgi:hypothetical protein